MIKRYFITGTDTSVGKTIVSSTLLKIANKSGYKSIGYKPVATGGILTNIGWRNNDALMLQSNSKIFLSYNEINPYFFCESTSPNIISTYKNKPIHFNKLSSGLRNLEQYSNWILIEGAGGWFTPLSLQHTFADWVIQEKLQIILVVGMKLGCINHALLTQSAILKSGLSLVGWVCNNITIPGKWYTEYLETLNHMILAPLLGKIPYFVNINNVSLIPYLDINKI
ncbi:ATP-dependent dethiobiotin synthetase BioD 1 [Serratia symbiotica]|nr:ATP-dependent dethiobiotin synthetase BioD 1 [Serratia symbiotica]